MNNAIHYFDPNTPAMIIAGKKDGAEELGVFYSGSLEDLVILRDLINDSIDGMQKASTLDIGVDRFAA